MLAQWSPPAVDASEACDADAWLVQVPPFEATAADVLLPSWSQANASGTATTSVAAAANAITFRITGYLHAGESRGLDERAFQLLRPALPGAGFGLQAADAGKPRPGIGCRQQASPSRGALDGGLTNLSGSRRLDRAGSASVG